MSSFNEHNYLCHYGVLGMKWGLRRYQNKDGSLTSAGKAHYGVGNTRDLAKTHAGLRRRLTSGRVAMRAVNAAANAGMYGSAAVGAAGGAAAGLAATGGNLIGMYGGTLAGGAVGFAGAAGINKIANKRLNKLNNEYRKLLKETNPVKLSEIEIKEGTKFVRTSLKEKEEGNGRLYVGYEKDKLGKAYYSTDWVKFLKESTNNPNVEIYANTLKTKVNIKAPNYETRKAAANAVINANKKLAIELGKSWTESNVRLMTGDYTTKGLDNALKTPGLTTAQVKDFKNSAKEVIKRVSKEYDAVNNENDFAMLRATIPTNDKLMNAYIKELKKQGYGAMYDDNAGTSEAAFIIFDQSNLEQIKSKKVNG